MTERGRKGMGESVWVKGERNKERDGKRDRERGRFVSHLITYAGRYFQNTASTFIRPARAISHLRLTLSGVLIFVLHSFATLRCVSV